MQFICALHFQSPHNNGLVKLLTGALLRESAAVMALLEGTGQHSQYGYCTVLRLPYFQAGLVLSLVCPLHDCLANLAKGSWPPPGNSGQGASAINNNDLGPEFFGKKKSTNSQLTLRVLNSLVLDSVYNVLVCSKQDLADLQSEKLPSPMQVGHLLVSR